MNNTPQEWLATGATVPGLLGCGLRLPDATCLSYSFNEMCPREHLDQILQQLAGNDDIAGRPRAGSTPARSGRSSRAKSS